MPRRLLDAGHDLLRYNRTPEMPAELGGRRAKVAEGPGGLIGSLPESGIHVAMGAHQIDAIRSLAAAHQAAGQKLVAAPVLGRSAMVAAVRLGIITAGPADARSAPPARTWRAGSAPCCGWQRR